MNKKDIGQYFTFTFKYSNGEEIFSGYVIDFTDEWVLLKYNVVDYVVDGYIILNTKFIIDYKRDEKQKFTQKLLDLKGQKPTSKETIPLTDLTTILKYISGKYGLFQFDMRTNKTCWLGKVKKITGNDMKIDYLTPRAIWSTTMPTYKLGYIRTIQFDTDYINSLLLVAKKKK